MSRARRGVFTWCAGRGVAAVVGVLTAALLATMVADVVWRPASAAAATAPAAGEYVPLAQTRIVDSRTGLGFTGPVTAGVVSSFQVAGVGGVPSSAWHSVEAWGIQSDMAIDRYKIRHNLGESSDYDEGPGSVVYLNPFHSLTRHIGFVGPAWHNAPGAWRGSHGHQNIDW